MDGSDALRFRRMLPDAEILALEPNPKNLASMESDGKLHRASIRILPHAASDNDSVAPFYVVKIDDPPNMARYLRGMSSLLKRPDVLEFDEVVSVRTVRLDSLLSEKGLGGGSIALWIDVEGVSSEVIIGASDVIRNIRLLHVEVETSPIIGAHQKLFSDVNEMLEEAGFVLLATDRPRDQLQFNALFVHSSTFETRSREIRWWTMVARFRRRAGEFFIFALSKSLRRHIRRLVH